MHPSCACTVTHIRMITGLEAMQPPPVSTALLRETHLRRAWLSFHVNLKSHISKGEVPYSRNSLVSFSVCKENQVKLYFWENSTSYWWTLVHGHLEESIMETWFIWVHDSTFTCSENVSFLGISDSTLKISMLLFWTTRQTPQNLVFQKSSVSW